MNYSKLKFFPILFVIISCYSCARSESISTDHSLYVKVKASNELEILKGEIIKVDERRNGSKILFVHFYSVSGGATHLFRKIKMNETNGDTYKRLSLLEGGVLKKKYSLNDILQLPTEVIDSMEVYSLY